MRKSAAAFRHRRQADPNPPMKLANSLLIIKGKARIPASCTSNADDLTAKTLKKKASSSELDDKAEAGEQVTVRLCFDESIRKHQVMSRHRSLASRRPRGVSFIAENFRWLPQYVAALLASTARVKVRAVSCTAIVD